MNWVEHGSIEWPPRSGNFASRMLVHKESKTKILISKTRMRNGSEWIHLSVTKPVGRPSWAELQGIKNQFIGADKAALQIFPKTADLVDLHDAYHLWCHVSGEFCMPNLQEIEWEIAG